MKVKQKENASNSLFQSKLFARAQPILFGALVLAVSISLFFGVLGYGAYLNRIGESTHYKHALVRISQLDFSFIKNYVHGRFSSIDNMNLDIKFKHLLRIQFLREGVLLKEEKYIDDELKNEEFPAKLTFKGKEYKVKISLTGKMVNPHLQNPNHWSFQVKVVGDHTLDGMKRFGMLVPKSRGHLTDWLGLKLMEDRGLITLRSDFKEVSINGKLVGTYYMEERFDKHLLENNQLREGIIFKIEDNLKIYQEEKLMAIPDSRSQIILLRQMWQNVATGKISGNQFFDIEKFACLFAIADLMNSRHPLLRDNLRFYFNPITGLVEPIAREFENLKNSELSDMALFLEKPKEGSWHFWVKEDKILQKVFNNNEFKKHYIQEAAMLSQEKLLDTFFIQHEDKLNELMSGVYKDWSFYDLPKYTLYENQDYIRSALYSGIPGLSAYFLNKTDSELSIEIANQQFLPLEITSLSWRDSIYFFPNGTIVLDSKEENKNEKINTFAFNISKGINWSDSILSELEINYNYLGLEKDLKRALVFPWSSAQALSKAVNPIVRPGNYNTFNFIQEIGNSIIIPKGEWTLSTDLVIPKGKRFKIEAGAKINLINHTKIISYSPIFTYGIESNPILIHSADSTGEGLIILKAKERSQLSYTTFDKISRPKEKGWGLSGALTFYESPVSILGCTFSNNKVGDDFLNIVRSHFSMQEVFFKDILADAFDCDFCTGTVTNTYFNNVGNDGIDVSGSTIDVAGIYMNGIGDKGLSAGENSRFTAEDVEIKNAEIAITSKDQSTLIISDSKITACRIGMALFQKKSEFGPGFIEAKDVQILQSEIDFLVEENSELIFDGKFMEFNRDNVKKILYGVEYGKSSN